MNLNKLFFRPVILFIWLISFSSGVFCQNEPFELGDIPQDHLELQVYAPDSGANAVVLGNYAEAYFERHPERGFQIVFDHRVRIKILKKEGYEHANVRVPLYRNGKLGEKILLIKGYTYNKEEKGQVERSAMGEEAIFTEEIDDKRRWSKFTLPNVREGSILEYSYRIISDYVFTLRGFDFQDRIPCLSSRYQVTLPEFFSFKTLIYGQHPFSIETYTDRKQTYNFGGNPYEAVAREFVWAMENVPAFKEEPYLTCPADFMNRIQFELASYKFPQQEGRRVMGTWESFTREILADKDFVFDLRRASPARTELLDHIGEIKDEKERMIAAYNFLKDRIKWNGKYSILLTETLDDVWEKRTGNVAEVNLLLTAMLNEAGINADPVILSTRKHGVIHPVYPLASKFNYVVAYVNHGDLKFLLDATDPFRPYSILPFKALNNKGRIIRGKNPDWVEMKTDEKFSHWFNGTLTLDESGLLSGEVRLIEDGYDALKSRKRMIELGEEAYISSLQKDWGGLEFESYAFENLKDISGKFKVSGQVRISDFALSAGNIIYLDPMLGEIKSENIFNSPDRTYPVDFGCGIDQIYVVQYNLPDGFVVEEVPENIYIALPNKMGTYKYNVEVLGNFLKVASILKIKESYYPAEEYGSLREFYNQMVEKQAEKIVLKRL